MLYSGFLPAKLKNECGSSLWPISKILSCAIYGFYSYFEIKMYFFHGHFDYYFILSILSFFLRVEK